MPLNSDTLHSTLGKTHYLDHGSNGSTGFNSGVSLQSTLPYSDFYMNDHNLTFQHNTNPLLSHLVSGHHLNSVQTSIHFNSTLTCTRCLAQASCAVRYEYIYSAYNIELIYIINKSFLHQASDTALIASQNQAYMHLFKEKIKLWGSLETLE